MRVPSGMEIVPILVAERAMTEARVGMGRCDRRSVAARDHDAAALAPPEPSLRQRGQGAPTGRTDPLVVLDSRVGTLVAEPELLLDRDQVLRVHAGRERRTAAPASRRLAGGPDRLVEARAELRRPLKHVEELAERQP